MYEGVYTLEEEKLFTFFLLMAGVQGGRGMSNDDDDGESDKNDDPNNYDAEATKIKY